MSDSTFYDVREFVAERSGHTSNRLTPETRLLHDLGIDADDAFELFLAFSERFGVDLSTMHWPDYFGSETGAPARWLMRLAGGPEALHEHPVTMQDLADAANAGRWVKQRAGLTNR